MTTEKTTLGQTFALELEHEAAATRKMLERLPAEKFDWKPHKKSTPLGVLAVHIAEMILWAKLAVTTAQLDYALEPYKPFAPKTNAELLEYFDKSVEAAIKALNNASDEAIMESWTVRNGERIYFVKPRIKVLRADCFNHFIHHRGQLSVYMRLNDIPLPGVYGPTADEQTM
jgi:uncharacterized damage-inducible protein DinB